MYKTLICLAAVAILALGASITLAGEKTGSFHGASDHITKGEYTISMQADGSYVITLEDNFSLDGAPDPSVGFGKDGKYSKVTYLGNLKNLKGKQSFAIPASVDLTKFNEVYIWCAKFTVPLGVAPLN
ncbi:MAG: DM13 domain-containing protein [Amylibacter sp.]